MSETICEGLQVLELGAGSVAASLAGMLLADNGARVVKLEPPEGDRLRTATPSGFLVWNRGKESMLVDLRRPDGQAQARRLASAVDVVIEAFGAGVADRWGIGPEVLRAANPGLVYCSIKGFGSVGPYAHLKAYEGIVAAKCGLYSLGPWGFRPGPIFSGAPFAGNGTAHMAAGGILGALVARQQSGRGQLVEATMYQGLNPLDYYGTMTWQWVQRQTGAAAGSSASSATSATRTAFFLPTADGRWVSFTQMLPHQAAALSRAVGAEHTLSDPRYARQPFFPSAEDGQAWEEIVWEAFQKRPYAEWEPILLESPDIAFELARTSEEGLGHPQIVQNREVIVIDDPVMGPVRQIGPVAAFRDTPAAIRGSAPGLGANAGDLSPAAPLRPAGPRPDHPLSGVTIVDFGFFYAMPYGVTMAAALGARVIKVEGRNGDPMRTSFGAPETSAAKTMEGKDSLSVDVSSPDGRRIVHELAAIADAFVLGFRPGVAERLGVDHATLSEINPRLLYVHAAGYGTSGPYAHRPIYAGVASAIAGSVHRHASTWLSPELAVGMSPMEAQVVVLPRLRGPVDGDSNAANAVFTTLMLGLYHQRRTGRGQFVSTTMIGGNALAYADDFNHYEGKEPIPLADPENLGLNALYRLYPTAAGWVFLAVTRDAEWDRLTGALTGLAGDERFSTATGRQINDAALAARLEAIFATREASAWERDLSARGVACVAAFAASQSEFTCTDETLRDTGLVVEVDHPLFGKILRAGPPVTLSDTPARVAPGSLPGQHTRQILTELGYTAERIADLEARQVVFAPATVNA